MTIVIQGKLYKNVVNAYLNCDNLPILRKFFFVKIAQDGGCEYYQHCRERHFHDFTSCNGCI